MKGKSHAQERTHTTWAEEMEREDDGQFAVTVVRFVLRARAQKGKPVPAAIVIDASSQYQVRWSRHLALPDPVIVANPDQIGPECFNTFDEF
jgi:hypothetical protein